MTEESSSTSFSVRWATPLVTQIDELARNDKRTRNNWLEVYIERKIAQDRACGALPKDGTE